MSGIRRGAVGVPVRPLLRGPTAPRHRTPSRPVLMMVASGAALAALSMAVLLGFSSRLF